MKVQILRYAQNDNKKMATNPHIIIGGGIIGLSVGWQLLRAGISVEIYEEFSSPRSGAGWVAAGMLAPNAEAGYEEEALFKLCNNSLSFYDKFLEELREDVKKSDIPKIDRCGSMIVAITSDDIQTLKRQYEFRKSLGDISMVMLSGSEAREREPLLSPKVKQALHLPNDAQINNRKLLGSLHEAFLNLGGKIHEHSHADNVVIKNGIAEAIRVKDEIHHANGITIAAGALIGKISCIESVGIRPVKGQVVTLRADSSIRLTQLIRSPRIYLAQKDDGRLLAGATVEEQGASRTMTAGPIMELLHYAWEAVPLVYELEISELQSGLRPASRDHCPIIGESDVAKLFYATGHYRNGILLAPLTAYALRDQIVFGKKQADLSVFTPQRFLKKSIPETV
jgi:glycine oxidase